MAEKDKVGGTKAKQEAMDRLTEAALATQPEQGNPNWLQTLFGKEPPTIMFLCECGATQKIPYTYFDLRYTGDLSRAVAAVPYNWHFTDLGEPVCPLCWKD